VIHGYPIDFGDPAMSTKMSEDDFVNAVAVFRTCLPRSGAKGRDDRLFLEALRYFSVGLHPSGETRLIQ
jgi:hypothetical protein